MPRPGGEADKLGNRYELLWAVKLLLKLLDGDFVDVTVEHIGEEFAGVDIVATTGFGDKEFHSVKRQHTRGNWTIRRLVRKDSNTGRSILGDLVQKTGERARGVFVSGTSAFDVEELIRLASTANSFDNFCRRLDNSGRRSGHFEDSFVPLCGTRESAYIALNRLEIVTANESSLTNDVNWRIRSLLRKRENTKLNATEVRSLIVEFILTNLGNPLTGSHLLELFKDSGYRLSRLTGRDSVSSQLNRVNQAYVDEMRSLHINNVPIQRQESGRVIELLTGGAKSALIAGTAGVGKSSVAAQVLDGLSKQGVPCLAIRVDEFSELDTSAQAVGSRLGLPESPVLTLGEFAGNRLSVLCIDQLDALSLVSGRRQAVWKPFHELLEEAKNYDSMRLLFVCRDFDLDIDSRIKAVVDEGLGIEQIRVAPLSEDVVLSTVRAAGINRVFVPQQIQVLSIPLNLYLFLETSRTNPVDFTAAGDLFDAYWEHKSRAVHERVGNGSAWSIVIEKICDELSARESLMVPEFALDHDRAALEAVASESVVSIRDGNVRFFHESYFDYCFARSFLRSNIDLVDWLLANGQHLFRRSQVRQVLAFLRSHEPDLRRYRQTLSRLLGDAEIRFHIKKLILDWLRERPDPTSDEWNAITHHSSCLGKHAENVPFNSVPWFDLLQELGQWQAWLDGEDQRSDLAIGLLRASRVLELRSNLVAELVRPYIGRSERWRRRLRILTTSRKVHCSTEMQDLVVDLVIDGTLDEAKPGIVANGDWWLTWYGLGNTNPRFAARLIGVWIDRAIERATLLNPGDPFSAIDKVAPYSQHSENVISACASNSPQQFVLELLPRLVNIDSRYTLHLRLFSRKILDPIEQCQDALIEATSKLANIDPELLDSAFDSAIQHHSTWTSSLLISAWTKNPDRYADRIVEFLLGDPESRLKLEVRASMTESDTFVAISRRAIASATPICSRRLFVGLENKILCFTPAWEARSRSIGRTELALLRALPTHRTSQSTKKRISELQRRFPNAPKYGAPESDPKPSGAKWIGSPIPAHAHALMSDEQWISAMATYREPEPRFIQGRMTGGALELSRELTARVKLEPSRFFQLPSKMRSVHSHLYFEAILKGLTESDETTDRPGTVEQVHSVITRISELGVQIEGQAIARAIESLANEKIPTDLLVVLRNLAMFDPDPRADKPQLEDADSGAVFHAINSVRGTAALAIGRLLFADRERWTHFEPAVKQLIEDRVLAVRSVAIECLLAVLDSERHEAFAGFQKLVQGADKILASHFVVRFLNYAIYRDFEAVRPTLVGMLSSENNLAVRAAARLLTTAALWMPEECTDLEFILGLSEDARVGAAQVFVEYLANESVGATCEVQLRKLFCDPSPEVRREAGSCWGRLEPDEIASRGSLIHAYLDSIGPDNHVGYLVHRLRSATIALPKELLSLADRAVAAYGEKASSIENWEAGAVHGLPTLMIRLYDESDDPQFRESVLDVIDRMVRVNILGVSEKLVSQFDR